MRYKLFLRGAVRIDDLGRAYIVSPVRLLAPDGCDHEAVRFLTGVVVRLPFVDTK